MALGPFNHLLREKTDESIILSNLHMYAYHTPILYVFGKHKIVEMGPTAQIDDIIFGRDFLFMLYRPVSICIIQVLKPRFVVSLIS